MCDETMREERDDVEKSRGNSLIIVHTIQVDAFPGRRMRPNGAETISSPSSLTRLYYFLNFIEDLKNSITSQIK